MSTVKSNTKIGRSKTLKRFAELAAMGETVFHAGDLASLWQIKDRNTLHTTLKRYNQQGLIYRLWRGMYAIKPIDQIDPWFLGLKALHTYAYVSCETILFRSGIIMQRPAGITLLSDKNRHFGLGGNEYHCRQLANQYLHNDFGVEEKEGIRRAKAERAVADLLHFNPLAHFDAENRIDWRKVRRTQKAVGYSLIR